MFSQVRNIAHFRNEPLKNHSSFKIGGNAKYFVSAKNTDELLDVLYICNQHSIKHKIVGNGSNILFDSLGYDGAIVQYNDNSKQLKNNTLHVGSGIDLSELIQYTTQHNLGGFEFAIGVPAKLGGAIVNNLGAYKQEISTYIKNVIVLSDMKVACLSKQDCKFSYHSSSLQNTSDIVLSATFDLPFQDKIISQTKMIEYITNRKNSQPLDLPNAGSIFRRTNETIPAKLIDEARLKGLTVGGSQISTKHAGFIVNLGNATSNDVLKLMGIVKQKIFEKYSIVLEPEIEYIPF